MLVFGVFEQQVVGDDLGEELQTALRGFLGGQQQTATGADASQDDSVDDVGWMHVQLALTIAGASLLLFYCYMARRCSNGNDYVPIPTVTGGITSPPLTLLLINPKLWTQASASVVTSESVNAVHAPDVTTAAGIELQRIGFNQQQHEAAMESGTALRVAGSNTAENSSSYQH